MPSAKTQRQQVRRHRRNKPQRTRGRSRVAVARAAIAAEPAAAGTAEAVRAAVAALDRAVAKGVIHRNAASRRKSRLMKALNRAEQAASS
ncbi:MAG: 30S ribosomal protein S20 [Gemmatimonadetes bacterium]|nr:30S ribosomal protein S20 [Gemmatimonadota bacterium]